jgi:hypothetical protein
MILVPGTGISIAASAIAKRSTRAPEAWLAGAYITVQLEGPLRAVRVHVGAGEGAVTEANIHLASGAGVDSPWYAIGDFVQPYGEYIASRAIPKTQTRFGRVSMFTDAVVATFGSGAVLNVGRAAPLFGHRGGGEQAEFLEGLSPTLEPIGGSWGRQYGHA